MDDQVEKPVFMMQKGTGRTQLLPSSVIRLKELLPVTYKNKQKSTLILSLELNVGLLLTRAQILFNTDSSDLIDVINMAVELSIAVGNEELLARCCVWQGLMVQQWRPDEVDCKFKAFSSATMILGHDCYPESRWLREFIEQNREEMERWNARRHETEDDELKPLYDTPTESRQSIGDNDDADSLYNHLLSDTKTPGPDSNELTDFRNNSVLPEAMDTNRNNWVANSDEFQGIDDVLQKIKEGKVVRGKSSRRSSSKIEKQSGQYESNTDASNTRFSNDNKAESVNDQENQTQEKILIDSQYKPATRITASESADVVVVEVPPPDVMAIRRRSTYISRMSAQLIRSGRGTSTPGSTQTRSNFSSRINSARAAEFDQSLRDLTGSQTRRNTLESGPSTGRSTRFRLTQRNDGETQLTDKPVDLTDTPAPTVARSRISGRLSIDTDIPVGQSRTNSIPIHHSPLVEVVSAEGVDEIG